MKYLPWLIVSCSLIAGAVQAAPVDLANSTEVVGSDGQVYSSIGSDFATSGLSMSLQAETGAGYALTLTYTTAFDGHASPGSVAISYPDIFLRLPESGYSTQPFTYALALGDQTRNGGMTAGFYTPQTVATSNDIWANRKRYIYGAGYQDAGDGAVAVAPLAAPVVMTAGAGVAGTALASRLTDTHTVSGGQEIYNLTVTVTGLSQAVAESLNQGFDAFWGTGDCANGSFLASVGGSVLMDALVPEPAGWPLAALGCAAVLLFRRRTQAN